MALRTFKPTSPARRQLVIVDRSELHKGKPVKALTEGLAPVPDIPPEIRAHWRAEAERLGSGELHEELRVRDPALAARLVPSDPQRIVRALEVIDATGISLAEWRSSAAPPVLPSRSALTLLVAPERETVYAAIDARFDRMLAVGAIDEVRALSKLDLDPGLPAMRAHGVRELLACLAGGISLEEAAARAKTAIEPSATIRWS